MARRARHQSRRNRTGPRLEPFAWLGVGAVTLGMGAALAGAPGLAHADDTSTSSTTSDTATTATTDSGVATQAATPPNHAHVWHLPTLSPPRKPHRPARPSSTPHEAAAAPKAAAASASDEDERPTPPVRRTEVTVEEGAVAPQRPAPAAVPAEVALAHVNSVTPKVVAGVTRTFGAVVRALVSPWSVSGTGGGSPTESPGVWVLAAVARREIGASADPVAAASAVAIVSAPAVASTDTAPVFASPTVGAPNSSTGVITGKVTATDADNDKLTYSAAAVKGTVSINSGTGAFTYTPSAAARHAAASDTATDADKSDTISVTVTDGNGGAASSAIDVTVVAKDNAPKISATVGNPNAATGVVAGKVTVTDADKDAVAYSVSSTTTKGALTFDASTGVYSYTPTEDARLAAAAKGATTADKHDTFAISVDDGHGGISTKTITVSVSPLGDKPVAGAPTVNAADDTGTVTGAVEFTQPYTQLPLTYTVTTATAKGAITVDAATGEFVYTPTAAARLSAGVSAKPVTDTFTVTAANSITSTSQKITVTVAPAVLAVTGSADATNAPQTVTGVVSPDGSTVYVANAGSNTVSVIDAATGLVTKTIKVGRTPSGLALKLDGSRLFVANAGSNTVTIINTSTRAVTKTIKVGSGPVGLAFSPDGTALYVTDTGADSMSVISMYDNRVITTKLGVTVGALATGPDSTIYVSDGADAVSVVSVKNGVDTPVVGTVTVGSPNTSTGAVTGSVAYTDPSGKTLTYKVITAPADGTVTVTKTGAFTYTPTVAARLAAALTDTTDTFTVVATNGLATTAQTVTVPVSGQVNASVALKMIYGTEPVVYVSINGAKRVPVLVDTGSVGLVITSKYVGTQQDLGVSTGSGASGYSGGLSYTFDTYATTVDFGNGVVSGPTSVDIVSAASQSAFASFAARNGVVGILGIGPNSYGPGPSSVISALPGDLNYGVLIDEQHGLLEFGPNPLTALTTVTGSPWTTLQVQVGNGVVEQVFTALDSGGVYGTIPSSLVGGASSVPVGTVIKVYTGDGSTLLYSYVTTSGNRPTVTSDTYMNSGYMPFKLGPIYVSYTGSSAGQTIFDL